MKNPLTLVSELFVSNTQDLMLTTAATLDFCYDHLKEEVSFHQEIIQVFQENDFQRPESSPQN